MNVLISILALFVVLFFFLFIREAGKRKQELQKQEELDKMLTWYIADNLDMEKKLSDMQYDYEKQQDMAEEVRRIQEQIRALKHDMKNHTLVILSYLEENRIEEARDYAGEILDKLNKMYTYVNVGNSLLNYIINNYTNIKSMLNLNIGSSMESHISHLIASLFSSRPKGFSTKRIAKYLKLNDYKNNNINIFKLYLSTYSKKKTTKLYENTYDYEIFTPDKIHNIPVLNNGQNTGTYIYLNNIAHEISTETYILNET